MSGSKTKPTDIIDLCSDDDTPARPRTRVYVPDDDVIALQSPPPHMKKWSNADKPIDIDGDGEENVEIYTAEERKKRRALMLEHDPKAPPIKKKKQTRFADAVDRAQPTAGPSTRSTRTRGDTAGSNHAQGVAGPSRRTASTGSRSATDVPALDHTQAARCRAQIMQGFADRHPLEGPPPAAANPVVPAAPAEEEDLLFPNMNDVLAEPAVQAAFAAPTNLSDPVDPPNPVQPPDNTAKELDNLLRQLIEILPDICPEYACEKLTSLNTAGSRKGAVEAVASKALDDGYPRRQAQKVEIRDDSGYLGKTYRAEKRIGDWYTLKCVMALEEAFAVMPVGHIREVMTMEANLFGPTYLHLLQDDSAAVKPYIPLKRARPPSKGKGHGPPAMDAGAVEFELEKNWVLAHVATERIANEAKANKELLDQIAIENGQGVECGCCFGEYVPDNMYQCRDGHLFCKECSTRHAETKLGDQSYAILCMDTSGCQAVFAETELARFLSTKSLELYHRLRLAQELEDAAIEGLETCPSCPWAVVIDNPEEKLIHCLNEACLKVSCRFCRKPEHLPLSCEEYAADRKKDKRHAVEDAMSEALIRKCPSCAKPYIKDTGCNKILCIKCRKYSCYICQKSINGYDHFDQGGRGGPGPSTEGKCRLWDPKEAENDVQTVVAARDAAVRELRERAQAEGVEVDEADLAVEAPVAPRPAGIGHPHLDANRAEIEAHYARMRALHPPAYPAHMGPEEGQQYAFAQAAERQRARDLILQERRAAVEGEAAERVRARAAARNEAPALAAIRPVAGAGAFVAPPPAGEVRRRQRGGIEADVLGPWLNDQMARVGAGEFVAALEDIEALRELQRRNEQRRNERLRHMDREQPGQGGQ